MNIIIKTRIFFLLLFLFSIANSQDFQKDKDYNEILKMLGINKGQGIDKLSQTSQLNISINPDEYMVDVGDVFIIKIDVKGPASKIFNASVYPEGYVVLEDVPSVFVKKMLLKDAKKAIFKSIKSKYKEALTEVFLFSIHPIEVTVLGAVKNPGILEMKSSDRLYTAFQLAIKEDPQEKMALQQEMYPYDPYKNLKEFETIKTELDEKEKDKVNPLIAYPDISLRNVTIERNGKRLVFDLLNFEKTGNIKNNPYLQNEDIIHFPYVDNEKYQVHVKGAVGNEIIFEYKEKETLKTALVMAGGLLPSADSTRIRLDRFVSGSNRLQSQLLQMPKDSIFTIYPDDRIFVKFKSSFHLKSSIEILGEIKYPGKYAITDGETTLLEMIDQAGSFSERASLKNAMLIRTKYLPEDKELNRLKKMPVSDMTTMEQSYFKLRSRENLKIVSVDFVKLFEENIKSENVILRDQDIIMIPEIKNIVFVSGGVFSPGNITHQPNWSYLDYINSAGGFNQRAIESKTKIIKSKTGVWLDAEDDEVVIEEGDIIFVPEEEETDWYFVFREAMTITFQVATITLLVANLVR